MSIWAHVLVKNEERFLWYSVMSVVPHVEKILLWDTGSTDKTLKIVDKLKNNLPKRIEIKTLSGEFNEGEVRQKMLDESSAGWFIVVDADEIWWEDSIKKVIDLIQEKGDELESVVVPTILPVGDMFHKQEEKAGRYKLAGKVGHYNLRAINRRIPGLNSSGQHGVWGWVDGEGKMIQDRDPKKIALVDAPYLHVTHLPRAGEISKDEDVVKRKIKFKFEIGKPFPRDFYYPEVFFRSRPAIVESPWGIMTPQFKSRAFFETPLRMMKRRVWWGKPGY